MILPLDKLDRQSAKELLISLARDQGSKEVGCDDDLEALLEELADIPLAISLAVPYLVYGSRRLLEEIKTRGVEPLEILNIPKDSQDKYTSLDLCFRMSYRTIEGSDADRVFQAASLFPAGFTRDDLEALLPGLAFQHVMTLESKSLLEQHEPGEFSLLAPLRHYAFQIFLDRTRPNDLEKQWLKLVIEKSREYENTVHGKGSTALNRLIPGLPNLYRALDYLLQEATRRQYLMENIFVLLGNMADFWRFQGIYRQAKDYLIEAGGQAKEAGDTANEANCIFRLGEIHYIESRNRDALRTFAQALPLYQKMGYRLGEANCVSSIGQIHIKAGNLEKGKNHLEQAINLYKTINSQYSIADACYEYALLLKDIKGLKSQAQQLFQKAAELFAAINIPIRAEECKKYLSSG